MPLSTTKGMLRSKAVWGAIFTILGATGVSVFGLDYNAELNAVVLKLDEFVPAVSAAAMPVGGVLSFFGRMAARTAIKGIF